MAATRRRTPPQPEFRRKRADASALRGFGDRAVHPAHQVAQLLTGHLDGVLGIALAQLLELLVAALDVGDELLDERAVLYLGEQLAHPVFGTRVDDPRAR